MKNIEHWKPTKYVFRGNKLIGSRDPQALSVSSRLQADLVADFYQQQLPLHATGHLADLGCGNVPFYALYQKNNITSCTCIDWPNSAHSHDYLDITCDLNQPLPVESNQYDTLILSDVLEHIAEPQQLWMEMARILKPGGKLLLNVPFFYKVHEAPHDYYRYTEFALRRFANLAGFEIIMIAPSGGAPVVFTDFFAKNIHRVPLMGAGLAALSQAMCRWFIRTSFGKKVSRVTGVTFPFGYFMIVQKK